VSFDLSAQLQKTLGANYRLERELGGGGMSRVFLAHEVALGRKVVVKVLLPELAAGVSVDRFRREIQLAAQLQHPHIVPLLSAGEADGLPYFTMPYITGESLAVKIARTGELPVSETVRILRDVASALGYAHEYGVVHRDIKPANVLLSGGVAVVTDFGVAKAVSASTDADTTHLTSIGMAIGTPAYMAPEQASGDPHVDHRADIYSVGVLTYEMLAGRTPFSGRPSSAVLAAHVVELPEAVDHRRPGIPPMLATLVMECLAKRPADRPQSAAAIIDVLDMLSTPSGGAVPATTVVRAPQAPAAPRRVPVGTVAAATLAVLGGGALWLYAGRGGGERQASPPAVDVRPRPVESAPARDSLPVASATREPTPAASTVPDSAAAPVVPAPAPVERRADPGRRARPGAQVRGSADRAPPRQAHRPEGAGAPIPSRIDSAPADAARAPAPAGAPAARTAPA
jgi:serine/threonine-protein kinase